MTDLPLDYSMIREVHAARRLLLSGKPGEALEQLRVHDSLDFATLRIVLGECYYSLGNFRIAREEFKGALRLAPNSPRAEILLELSTSMLELERAASPLPQSIHPRTAVEDLSEIGQLARKLSDAGVIKMTSTSSASDAQETGEIGLVSETLAKIMAQQGQYEDARKVYIQLSRLNPDRYEYFRERMNELDRMKNTFETHSEDSRW
ncbi:MAG TPA: tetratricopeptide repeat protein [Candidatus Kapabacteria bacterium]|jgi:tetratricopeptide (TPR) repeat protein|nr:tetratricopeptide repeat protein [Candidatus Kapabacteria bacterium]